MEGSTSNRKWHNCNNCGKNLSSYKCLWRHKKKTCKGVGNYSGSGILYSTKTDRPQVDRVGKTSNDLVHNSKKIEYVDIESGSTGGDSCDEDTMDVSSTAVSDGEESFVDTSSDEDGVDVTGSDEDGMNDVDFDLWENFVEFTIEIKKWTILDTLCYFLIPYYLRSEDDTYKEIMYDVEEALHYQNMSYLDALSCALEKNKQIVLTSIANARVCDADDSFDIWSALAALDNKNKECNWLSYSPCYCNDCCGTCVIIHLEYMLLMFHHMDTDEVIFAVMKSINQILKDDDEVTLWDASHIAVKNHENVILEKAREAEKEISGSIIPSISSGSGMYLNPWRYSKNSR